MLRNRLYATLAVFALAGVAACGGEEEPAAGGDAVVTDTLVGTETVTQEVQVQVPDSQAVVTDIDTAKDTVDINQR